MKVTSLAATVLFMLVTMASQQLLAAPRPVEGKALADSAGLYTERTVSFQSGKHRLTGRLLTPSKVKNNVPAIVFCVGSGTGSTVSGYESFLDSLLEQRLPMDSIAFLYFDKRGLGASEGKWHKTDFEERAADTKAAADYLATLSFIDKNRIAVVGHSQGGWITQICLAKYPDTFVGGISLAGPTFGVREQVRNDYASVLMCQEQLSEQAAREKALRMVNRDLFFVSLLPVRENWKQLKVIKKFDPGRYIPAINKPLLLMFGENDPLVSPKHSITELNNYFPHGIPSNFEVVTIEGASHSFKVADFCHRGSTKDLPYAEESKKQIGAWVRTVLLQR